MNWRQHILPRAFYLRNPQVLAKKLLGKYLVRKITTGPTNASSKGRKKFLVGRIVETEAYLPFDDTASHGFKRETPKTKTLHQKEGGHAYVYTMHTHNLFNVTAEKIGRPGAVLIRAIEPVEGIELTKEFLNGPGKLSRAMEITRQFDGMDITSAKSDIFIAAIEPDIPSIKIEKSKRIGVTSAHDELLRFRPAR
jgi:DNA-3-methyladenine glycosylase